MFRLAGDSGNLEPHHKFFEKISLTHPVQKRKKRNEVGVNSLGFVLKEVRPSLPLVFEEKQKVTSISVRRV